MSAKASTKKKSKPQSEESDAAATKLSREQFAAIKDNQLANAIRKIQAGRAITSTEQRLIDEAAKQEEERPKDVLARAVVPNMAVACEVTRLRLETLRLARDRGCPAFRANGTVNTRILLGWLSANPEIVKETEDIPDYKSEKALRERSERIRSEVNLSKDLEQLVTVDALGPIFAQLGKSVLSRLMVIPDRVAQIYAAMDDQEKIRQHLRAEIEKALRVVSEIDPKEIADKALREQK